MADPFDDQERDEFYAVWRAMPVRLLLPVADIDWNIPDEIGDVVRVRIVEAPAEYAHTMHLAIRICPACGVPKEEIVGPVTVGIYPTFTIFPSVGFGAIAHRDCLERCPILDEPTPIPA